VTEPDIRLQIIPEPTDEEAAAVAAAIALIAASRPPHVDEEPKSDVSRWRLAGRIAAHNSSPTAHHRRWSRIRHPD
jgi:hypothetical protein